MILTVWIFRLNYSGLAELNSKLKIRFEGAVHEIHSSQLIKESGNTLLAVCPFLQLNCDQQYIKDCFSIIYKEGTKRVQGGYSLQCGTDRQTKGVGQRKTAEIPVSERL